MCAMARGEAEAELAAYLAVFPEDAGALEPLRQQLERGEDVYSRHNFTGHLTAAGIVLSADHRKVLLIHHKNFKRWQQPGGHIEQNDATPRDAARREVLEETGQRVGQPHLVRGKPTPLHISAHFIPANAAKGEPAHWHYDFRYLFTADAQVLHHQEEEVSAAGWFLLDAPEAAFIAATLQRLRTLPEFQAGS